MRNLILFLLSLFAINCSYAQDISIAEAEKVAKNFFYERSAIKSNTPYDEVEISSTFFYGENNEIYILNIKQAAYVLVSGNKNSIPVLGYSFNGNFDINNMPPQLEEYMQKMASQISFLSNQEKKNNKFILEWQRLLSNNNNDLKLFSGREIEPMLYSTWDQDKYYNEQCPQDPGGPGGRCYAGCVATAMGQVMNYFRWPETGTGSYTYECPPYGTLSANFSEATYSWNEMPLFLDQQNFAIGQLLNHLGISVDMVYGPNGSGMYNHKAAYSLRTYFKYSPETQYVYRDSTTMDWDSLLVDHLYKNMPMYYAGWSVPNINGHAFVLDGYQDPYYYHFNWGWSGSYDGYFYTDNLSPGGSNFNLAQEVIINCFPDTLNYNYPYYCSGPDTLRVVSGTIDDGSGPNYNYEQTSNCSWLISPEDSVNFISIDFLRFNTSAGDTLALFDGSDSQSPLLGKFSGNETPESVVSTSDQVFVQFNKESTEENQGWLLSYTSDIPVYCSGMTNMTAPTDTLSDGSGPRNYHNESTCLWNIKPPDASEITLYFMSFNTQANKDVVKVYDGSQLITELSGNEIPDPITAYNGSIFLTFSTNEDTTAPGWEAYYISNYVGIDQNTMPHANIYPNPAKDEIFININNGYFPKTISIYSITGELLFTYRTLENKSHYPVKIDIKELNPGIYFIEAEGNFGRTLNKLLKRE